MAPISGVVLERPVVVGQRVEEAAALFRIAKLAPLWVELQVPVAGHFGAGGRYGAAGRPPGCAANSRAR
ncbi:efflux RND transporter periplasmic adaptor subunit [Roseateles sp. GG27B]